MKNLFLSLCLVGFVSVQAQISEQNLEKTISYLAVDKMQGRQTGSKQVHKASKFIEKQFKKLGLAPKGEQGYRQSFTAKVSRVKVNDSLRKADNIIGFLDNGAEKTIVVGAHYDHIGHGELGNSRDDKDNIGKIHNGADDNASGVAGLLELARYYSQNQVKEKYNILFIAFGAEELGLFGSKYFVEHPTIPLNTIHWMLNMDMIGRYNPENGLAVIGYGTSPAFVDIFKDVHSDIKFNLSKDGRGGSDQTSFYDKKIPVLFFHTGGHPDYHKHGDDAHKINYKAMKSILELEAKAIDNSMKVSQMDFVWTN
ncbi:M20/M25/M40 family metallo-hydrolase [Elizabethkingia sp. JS20170427COW]|uniref:M20/M25/M40 family metallo-hydrolase n=1 Tax=Elizabethkingia sp. JS20170427COW TaxID=2583851 RepID=UPI0011105D3B|nr:M20/M25/M40 family metallo-hydrolase [Elizabethkingia sp. JS20170427COW]QCX53041.1 M20/M25/M40 family metallo-hydrolase [Elizabethkingia sp. JS20170427COW]